MIHRKRRMPASVFQGATACILIGAVAIAPAQAQTFNLAEFVKSYEDQTGGRVYEIEREIASGRAVYDIESSRGEEIYELQIDMVTGELVSEKVEDASWRLISKRKKTALWNAPHSLGDILIANPNFSGDVIVDEISSRVRDGSVIYTVDVRGSGKLVLDATDVEVVPVLTNVAHNGDTADREFMRDIRPEHWFWNGMDPLIVDQILARIKSADAPRERPEYHDGIT
ncbi:MAG: PepSY domain-containing protein, partial [Pseudomonadota bacterium]